MKKFMKYMVILGILAAVLGSAAVAFAAQSDTFQRGPRGQEFGDEFFQQGPAGEERGGEFFQRGPRDGGPGRGPGRGRGLGGEVTAIDGSTLTILNRNDDSIVVNVSEDTTVRLAETQSEGSLSDIEVGDNVGVRGRRNDDGSVDARAIMVAPEGDHLGGKVSAVDGQTITVENRDGEAATITTDGDTTFRIGRDETGSLADVTPDKFVMAFGTAQGEDSLQARLVFVGERGPGRHGPGRGHGAAGEVTAISGDTFTLDPFRGENEITVQTNADTEYRTCDGQDVDFGDIAEGKMVMVKGQPVEGQTNTILAEVIFLKTE